MKPTKFLILSTFAVAVPTAHAATIYSETFDTTVATSVSTYGWQAYSNAGVDLFSSTADPVVVNTSNLVFIASGAANVGGRYALISAAGTINPALYENDLTISFNQSATAQTVGGSTDMGWRVFAKVDSAIYASNFTQYTATTTTINVILANAVWSLWTVETNLSDGFNVGNISGTSGNLPAGTLSDIGILALDGNVNNDRMRLDDFAITGTAIPEPSTALLGGLGALLLLRGRRN